MKNKASKYNYIIDAVLFTGVILMFFFDLTGEALHQWIGLALGSLALYHLLRHWGWAKSVTRRFFGRATGKSRLYWMIDLGLLLGFTGILLTGLAISSWLSSPLEDYAAWAGLHETFSIGALILVVLKIAVHWRWIVRTSGQIFPRRPLPAGRLSLQPAAVSIGSQRRDFLKLMCVVSAAALMALANIEDPTQEAGARTTTSELPAPQVAQETKASPATPAATQTPVGQAASAADPVSSAQPAGQPTAGSTVATTLVPAAAPSAAVSLPLESSSAAACVTRCRKGKSCSFPGDCRDYRDTNGNGRCDNGECA